MQRAALTIGSEEAHELHHHDQGTRRRLGQGQPIEHLGRTQPPVYLDRLLGDEGQDRVGATERDDRGAAEEERQTREHVPRPEQPDEKDDRHQPEDPARDQHRKGPTCRRTGRRSIQVGKDRNLAGTCGAPVDGRESPLVSTQPARAHKAEHGRRRDDQWKGHGQEEETAEREDGDRHQRPVRERAPADPDDGRSDDRQHGWSKTVEQSCDERRALVTRVEDAERQDGEEARQYEQRAREQSAPDAVHEPADVDRQLLGFRARQQHAVAERVQESRLGDPVAGVDQYPVHDRDLPGRPSEAVDRDVRPDLQRLAKRRSHRIGASVGDLDWT